MNTIPASRILSSHRFLLLLIHGSIILAVVYLLAFLYTGGRIPLVHLQKLELATLVIVLSVLILIRSVLNFRAGFSDRFVPIVLFCSFHILYMANYKTIWATDTIPARYLPFSILREADFDLDEFQNLYSRGHNITIINTGEHYVSAYPVGPPILATPFYLVSALGLVKPNDRIVLDLEKLAAATFVALSAVILYLTLRRLTGPRMAAAITIIYALASSSFSVSSQALWQHGASQLSIVCTLYCLVRGREESRWIAFAGFPCAFSVICRPVDLLIAVPISLYVLIHHTRIFPKFVLFALPCVVFQVLYNAHYFLNPARTQFKVQRAWMWHTPFWLGLTGLLLSPARGLFIYSPVFLFSFVGTIFVWRKKEHILMRYLLAGVLTTIFLYSKYAGWWGGYTYGPRLLADLTPILALCLFPMESLLRRSKAFVYLFAFLAVCSIAAHANGAYFDDGTWNSTIQITNIHAYRAWYWTDNQLINTPKRWIQRTYFRMNGIPTSVTSPEAVDTSLKTDLPSYMVLMPSGTLPLQVDASNTGKAVWICSPNRGEGTVRFQWNWRELKKRRAEQIDTKWLQKDIFPGENYAMNLRIKVPQKEGDYVLELGFTTIHDSKVVFFGQVVQIPVRIVAQGTK